jgi:hypothetical protein
VANACSNSSGARPKDEARFSLTRAIKALLVPPWFDHDEPGILDGLITAAFPERKDLLRLSS